MSYKRPTKKTAVHISPFSCYGGGHSNLTVKRPNASRKYVKHLLAARYSYVDNKTMYPGIKNPMVADCNTLTALGYMEKVSVPEAMNKYGLPRKIWWKTTAKGCKLLRSLGL